MSLYKKAAVFIGALLLLLAAALFSPISTENAYADIASGTSGTCSWVIADDGTLTISPTDGVSGTLANTTSYSNWGWYSNRTRITKVVVDTGVSTSTNAVGMFYGETNLVDISGLSNLDVSPAASLKQMFYNCGKITSISVLSNWTLNTAANVNLYGMFQGCTGLTSLSGISGWNVSRVTDMGYMFHGCTNMTSLSDLSSWTLNTTASVNMSNMFQSCTGLTSLSGISGWNVSGVTSMSYTFSDCTGLTSLSDLSSWTINTTASVNMAGMFYNCTGLTSLSGISGWNVSKVTSTSNMFHICTGLTSLSGISGWNVSGVTNMSYMFEGCNRLTSLSDLSSWTINTTASVNMSNMFSNCTGLTSLTGISGWNVSKATNMSNMFQSCTGLTSLSGLSNWNVSGVTNMSNMFSNCPGLTSLSGISSWNVSRVTNTSRMFQSCTGLTSLSGLSNWNVSSVTNMTYMFRGCTGLISLDLSNWTLNTTSNVNMSYMFQNCSNLTSLSGLSNWNTSRVTNLSYMFMNCSKLSSISDISGWTISIAANVNMTYMFANCAALTSASLSNWNVSRVTNTSFMFQNCSNMTSADFSSWNTLNDTAKTSMFTNCSKLSSITLGSNFVSLAGTNLPGPSSTAPYNGKWTNGTVSKTNTELLALSQPNLAGTWTWERTYPVKLAVGYGTVASPYFATGASVQVSDTTPTVQSSWTQAAAWNTVDLYPGEYTMSTTTTPSRWTNTGDVVFKVDASGAVYIRREVVVQQQQIEPSSSDSPISLLTVFAPKKAYADEPQYEWVPVDAVNGEYYLLQQLDPSGAISIDVTNGSGTSTAPAGFAMSLSSSSPAYSHTWTTTATSATSDAELVIFDSPGTYTLSVTSAPVGWVLPAHSIEITVANDYTTTVSLPSGYDAFFTCANANTATSGIVPVSVKAFEPQAVTVSKTDSDTGDPISGVAMQALDSLGTPVASWTSGNAASTITLAGSSSGTSYSIHEVSPPAGYQAASDVSLTVYNTSATATQSNDPVSTFQISIDKQVASTGYSIPGAGIELLDSSDNQLDAWTTNGSARSVDLVEGTYTLHETSTPAGYDEPTDLVFTVGPSGTLSYVSGDGSASGSSVVMTTTVVSFSPTGVLDPNTQTLLLLPMVAVALIAVACAVARRRPR